MGCEVPSCVYTIDGVVQASSEHCNIPGESLKGRQQNGPELKKWLSCHGAMFCGRKVHLVKQ